MYRVTFARLPALKVPFRWKNCTRKASRSYTLRPSSVYVPIYSTNLRIITIRLATYRNVTEILISRVNDITPVVTGVTFSRSFQVPEPDTKFSGFIPLDKVQIKYCASSGPGGQNVNCVNTKVDLRFQLDSATWLAEEIRTKLREQVHV